MTTSYYLCQPPTPAVVMRRADGVDEAFVDGQWRPTKTIVDFMFGEDDDVTGPVDEQVARAVAPEAFEAAV